MLGGESFLRTAIETAGRESDVYVFANDIERIVAGVLKELPRIIEEVEQEAAQNMARTVARREFQRFCRQCGIKPNSQFMQADQKNEGRRKTMETFTLEKVHYFRAKVDRTYPSSFSDVVTWFERECGMSKGRAIMAARETHGHLYNAFHAAAHPNAQRMAREGGL